MDQVRQSDKDVQLLEQKNDLADAVTENETKSVELKS